MNKHPMMRLDIALICISIPMVSAYWVVPTRRFAYSQPGTSVGFATFLRQSSQDDSSWSITDDWDSLSFENPENTDIDGEYVFNQDLALNAANEMADANFDATKVVKSEDDIFVEQMVDEIHNSVGDVSDPPLYDTNFHEMDQELDRMEDEMAMLVHCNQKPETLLVSEGRAVQPLTDKERNDTMQLLDMSGKDVKASKFLRKSVSTMFKRHAVKDTADDLMSLDRPGVARWMTQSLKTEEGRVSAHDSRVLRSLSDFGSYGSGRLLEEDLQDLYLSAVLGDFSESSQMSLARHLTLRDESIKTVWRDLRNHGILSPNEKAHQERQHEVEKLLKENLRGDGEMLLDECEILNWEYDGANSVEGSGSSSRSSHKDVQMTEDGKAPLMMKDGEFVFIDEESCIGCMQCVNVSPNSFTMLESGRARTFSQRNSGDVSEAVASCPVSCMHPVSFDELVECESARDEGDGRTDHKHLGHRRGHTPLHVAGIDSDNNHRSSWYHTLKGRCLVSSQCPQRGCYDCPRYSGAGQNPFFKKRQSEHMHSRAQDYIQNGDADKWRKTADL